MIVSSVSLFYRVLSFSDFTDVDAIHPESECVVALKKPGPPVAQKPEMNLLFGDRSALRINLKASNDDFINERIRCLTTPEHLLDVDVNADDDDDNDDRRDPRRRLSYPDGKTPTNDEDLSPEELTTTPEIRVQGEFRGTVYLFSISV